MARRSLADRRDDMASIEIEIARLRDLDLRALRMRWQGVTGHAMPTHVPKHLVFAMLAYRLQADALGDPSVQLLKRAASASSTSQVMPLTARQDQRKQELLQGAILTREWNGHAHRVMVVEDGFAWEGKTYDSLSRIAFAITGTKWNGPRFFGLRAAISEAAGS
jgi:Protein of unknown function (DUF2924)